MWQNVKNRLYRRAKLKKGCTPETIFYMTSRRNYSQETNSSRKYNTRVALLLLSENTFQKCQLLVKTALRLFYNCSDLI